MFNMILTDHNINVVCIPLEKIFEDTRYGKWLTENNVNYRVSLCHRDVAWNKEFGLHDVIMINSIEFFTEEDFIAFKLQWS